jgi:hypothetical protein
MSKPSPRSSVRKLSSFDICSIPKKPPAPSLTIRRAAAVEEKRRGRFMTGNWIRVVKQRQGGD